MKFIFFIFLTKFISCARILGIFPMPFHSHQSVFRPIWRDLSLRGHQVTVIATNPLNDASLTNLKEIDVSFTYKLVYENLEMQAAFNNEDRSLEILKNFFMFAHNMTLEQLRHSGVQKLIKRNDHFDLMIVESHVPAWFGFAKKYKCPVIAITSVAPTSFFKKLVGDVQFPSIADGSIGFFDEDLTLFQKLTSTSVGFMHHLLNNYFFYPSQEKIIRDVLKDPDIDIYKILRNISIFLTNEIPGFSKVTTSIPSVIKFNGLQIQPYHDLPQELNDFLNGAVEGAIYFSLGSVVKSSLIDKKKQEILLDVFKTLPFRIIWKYESTIENLPLNVKLVSWAPQQDILRHKNTKLFITHGGLKSLDEAVRFKVPILGVPFFEDQFYNVIQVKQLKIGTWLDFKSLTKKSLKEAISETLNNTTYLENFEEMLDLADYSLNSLDKVVWWIEYVIQHKGASHLKSTLADISFYQLYITDVIVFLLILSTTFILVILVIIKNIFSNV